MNQEQFINILESKGISLSSKQKEQFEIYYQTLVEWNEKMNLTAITQKEDVYLKHFYDSLTISFDYDLNNQSLCDVGAGAGFPSIPLKIVYPDLKITIVDSLSKRITFLKHLFQVLDLKDVEAVSARAEEYALKHRESFDIVTARAVARLNILDELCLPLVKVGGDFITLKGLKAKEELNEAKQGIEKLGGKVVKEESFTLTDENDHRCNIYIHKVKNTPSKYPRDFSRIKKKPL
ncbi:16S rRNA (guanine(527)-N(7))-methyltransferase RsmG [Allocoprobacillus halotolerans]|uniref:Ribosomal RNA small subunit methyltransferase G n=1 Tax=Allocoprobacillus halotolerans TaxID=2944914 RepID=A0ABY5I7B6_9FIRM|nr:16S rRNA (guanine(527)-N(7))-methyltransferase RsmG [Allocoprobacillus halotolerans]UTY40608.1 16S rRNA (guanine(527)-N(7))-methyltransferase RsmG [Allocoprobacillus halotolerans]